MKDFDRVIRGLRRNIKNQPSLHEVETLVQNATQLSKVMNQVRTSMTCDAAPTQEVCGILTTSNHSPRCSWNGNTCLPLISDLLEKTSEPLRVFTEKNVNTINKRVETLESKLDDPEKVSPQTLKTVAASPIVIDRIKKEPSISQKTIIYAGLATAILGTIARFALFSSTSPADAIPPELINSVANNTSNLISEGLSLPATAITLKLIDGVKWLMGQQNLSTSMRKKLEKVTEQYDDKVYESRNLENMVDTLEETANDQNEEMVALRSQIETLRSDIKKSTFQIDSLKTQLGERETKLEQQTSELQTIKQQLEQFREVDVDDPVSQQQFVALKVDAQTCLTDLESTKKEQQQTQSELESIRKQLSIREQSYNTLRGKYETLLSSKPSPVSSPSEDLVLKLKQCQTRLEDYKLQAEELKSGDVGKVQERMQKVITKMEVENYKRTGKVPAWEYDNTPEAFAMASAKIDQLKQQIMDSDNPDLYIELEWYEKRLGKTPEYQEKLRREAEEERKRNLVFEITAVPVELSFFSFTEYYRHPSVSPEELTVWMKQYVDSVVAKQVHDEGELDHLHGLIWSVFSGDQPKLTGGMNPEMLKELKEKQAMRKQSPKHREPSPKPTAPPSAQPNFLAELKSKSRKLAPPSAQTSLLAEIQARKKISGDPQTLKLALEPKPIPNLPPPPPSPPKLTMPVLLDYAPMSREELDSNISNKIQLYVDSSQKDKEKAAENFMKRRIGRSYFLKIIPRLYAYKRQRDLLEEARKAGDLERIQELKTSVNLREGSVFGPEFKRDTTGGYKNLDWVEIQTMLYLLPIGLERDVSESGTFQTNPERVEMLKHITDLRKKLRDLLKDRKKTKRNEIYTNKAFPPLGLFWGLDEEPEVLRRTKYEVVKYSAP
jgi:septal ring factor EnvC (AmiA/AmiB activator)